jgi:hypothetical protein
MKSDENVLCGYWEAMFWRKSEGAVFAVITVHLVLGGCSNLPGNLRYGVYEAQNVYNRCFRAICGLLMRGRGLCYTVQT